MSEGNGYEKRYEVTSISGFAIGPEAHIQLARESGNRWTTEWYVVDRFHCFNVVRVCRTGAVARRACHLMNMLERRWEVTGA